MKTCSVGVREDGKLRSFKFTQEGIKEKKQTPDKQEKKKQKQTTQNKTKKPHQHLKWQQALYPLSILRTPTFPPV